MAVITVSAVIGLVVIVKELKESRQAHDRDHMNLIVEKDKTARLDEKLSNITLQLDVLITERDSALKAVESLDESYKKLIHQKKSSEVRVGKIGENLAPFLNGWPYDPNSFRFLGNPIDGIQFANDKIRFVEIKTGKARLSASQKHIKELVKQGKVSFVSFRIGEDGCTLIEDEIET
ncbi:MAG: hypothetical protein DRQ47_11060 [Gammaproteobacteria bacterium]|nr:MAG: hypothetical protein DRQ47_11060 [Gammaproteobacteria bacterium]